MVEQDLVHSLYCIPIGHLGTEEDISYLSPNRVKYAKITAAFAIQLAYSTGSPLASREEGSHARDTYAQTPAGRDSNSPRRLSGHSDTPLAHTGAEKLRETPDEHSGEKRSTSGACYTRT